MAIYIAIVNYQLQTNYFIQIWFQDDNQRMREEIESLRRKYEALKGFANLKKIRVPAEFEQYQNNKN